MNWNVCPHCFLTTGKLGLRATTMFVGAGLLWLVLAGSAVAQNYRFQVQEMDLQVYVQPDASARLEYKIVFLNQSGAHAIDVVDVGLPHRKYSISNMSASIDGEALSTIRKSEYIDVGVEVHLDGRQIPAGGQGTFRFKATMPDMVYQDTTDQSCASLQMIPMWFDPKLQLGPTHLKIAVHFPVSVAPEEVTFHNENTRYHNLVLYGDGDEKHAVAVWDWPQQALSSANPKVGVSFPKRSMQRVVTISALGLLVKWFEENPEMQMCSGAAMGILFLFIFFRFSHGTGWVLGLLLLGGLVFLMFRSPGLHLFAWLPMIGLCVWNEWGLSHRKSSYLPALATVEGGGIKRGLTAPQAAVLLELPLGKVLTLVVFGLLKKGLVTMTSADPLTVEVVPAFHAPRKLRKKAASKAGIVVHNYEHPFLDKLMASKKIPVGKMEMQGPLKSLVVATAGRMKGFDLSDSTEYYQRIVQRAWREAETIGEIDQRTETVDRNIDWMMMDPHWDDRFDHWESRGYHYYPHWASSHGGGASLPSPAPTPATSNTSFGEVAASFTGWAENTSSGLVSAIEPGSLGIQTSGGIVDLSGLDRVTADVFAAIAEAAESSGSGGGGGGGCACAGCACACACAGGGR